MISLLRGTIRVRSPFILVLDVSGIGYEVLCTQEAYDNAPVPGQNYELWTRLIVREDSLTLFGFSSLDERTLFDQIISVSGIGPKTAIAILSSIGAMQLKEAIRSSDIHRLTGIPGIGRKTAERMIVELRDKLLKEEIYAAPSTTDGSKIRGDALQALMALGYQRAVAEKAIRNVVRDMPESAKSTEALLKAALKEATNN
jgi:Holliday junction DNA helicase RuvA